MKGNATSNGYFGSLMRMTGIGSRAIGNSLGGEASPAPIHTEETRFAEPMPPATAPTPQADSPHEPAATSMQPIHPFPAPTTQPTTEKGTGKESEDRGQWTEDSEYRSYRTNRTYKTQPEPETPAAQPTQPTEKGEKGTGKKQEDRVQKTEDRGQWTEDSEYRSDRTHRTYPTKPEPESPPAHPTQPLDHSTTQQAPTHPEPHPAQITLKDVRQWVAAEPEPVVDIEIDSPAGTPGEVILKENAAPRMPWQPTPQKEEQREFSLSIGSINLTVESPQPEAPPFQTVTPLPPVQPSGSRSAGEDGSSSRLGRHYIRMR